MITRLLTGCALILLFSNSVLSQKLTLHGTISDAANGEALIGATILVKGTTTGVVTNHYGFYSLTINGGKKTILVSYIGYQTKEIPIDLTTDKQLHLELEPDNALIEEVVIKAEGKNYNVTSTKIGVQKMEAKQIEKIPVLFGEPDVIKAIKLLPGVSTTSETSSNISVRGGSFDQNLILLDEATVYSASHMLGLFSVFNNDAIRNVEFYKGAFPAEYGGRLSSVIDIRMKEGSTKEFKAKGNIGLISTKLTLEIPVIKDRMGLLLSGRRTYLDLMMKAASKVDSSVGEVPYFFYDYNAKTNFKINDNNRIYLSGYFGRDVLRTNINENNKVAWEWGNYTGTVRWNSILSKKLFMNITLLTSNYDFLIDNQQKLGEDKTEFNFKWKAFMKDYSTKADFGYFLNSKNTIKFGGVATYHDYSTGEVSGKQDTTSFQFRIPKYYSAEYAVYISNKQKVSDKLHAEYGLRASFFQNLGPGVEHIVEDYEVEGNHKIDKNKSYNTDNGFEPRAALSYIINDKNSVKLGYARTKQYVQVASNSLGGTPIDIWIPATNNIKPQLADQVSGGFFRNFLDNQIETSIELYYKRMYNQVEFREFSQPYLNEEIEEDFRFGNGKAYGAEFYVNKKTGKINGWISYTLSRSEKKINDYWEKDWYVSSYDNTHNLSVVANYDITENISVSANWVYSTGKPFDAPVSRFEYGNQVLIGYPGKNKSRYPDYHRLDIGANMRIFPDWRLKQYINISVYNAYARKNANIIYFEPDDNNPVITKAYRYSLLPRIFTFAYSFEF